MSNSEIGQSIRIFSYPFLGYMSLLKLGERNLGARQKSGGGVMAPRRIATAQGANPRPSHR